MAGFEQQQFLLMYVPYLQKTPAYSRDKGEISWTAFFAYIGYVTELIYGDAGTFQILRGHP